LDTLGIRFWKERIPLRWRSTIRIAFGHTALPITGLVTKAMQIRDEESAIASSKMNLATVLRDAAYTAK
jgi:hypothetical protein